MNDETFTNPPPSFLRQEGNTNRIQLQPDVSSGSERIAGLGQGESASRGTSTDIESGVRSDSRHGRQEPGSRNLTHSRYVVERGGGANGTAYNVLDHEVIDKAATAGTRGRVVCRATGANARLISFALNQVLRT